MFKRYLIPGIYIILALALFIGNSDTRLHKAQWLGKTLFLPFTKTIQSITTIRQLKEDNFALQNKLANQTLTNLALSNQIRLLLNNTNIRLDLHGSPYTMAEVVGYAGQFHERSLIVNKGSADGVEQDSPVVSADGIVGKTILVNAHNSVVLPITHSEFQLAVMDKNSDVQGELQADLSGQTYMNLIKLGSQISIGDTVLTSNLSRLFPKGFPVGKISRIKESQDNLFLSAEIEPFTLVENLEHVFILKKEYIAGLLSPMIFKAVPDTLR